MSKYKAEWKPMSKNEDFWKEVLVGRTITSIDFHETGMKSFTLDSGEVVSLHSSDGKPTISIQD